METLFYVLMLTGAVWGASAYTFSHLNATILLFDNTANNERTKRIWIPVYNVMFVVFPLVWLGVIVVSDLPSLSDLLSFNGSSASIECG